jgi:hypothetical protein
VEVDPGACACLAELGLAAARVGARVAREEDLRASGLGRDGDRLFDDAPAPDDQSTAEPIERAIEVDQALEQEPVPVPRSPEEGRFEHEQRDDLRTRAGRLEERGGDRGSTSWAGPKWKPWQRPQWQSGGSLGCRRIAGRGLWRTIESPPAGVAAIPEGPPEPAGPQGELRVQQQGLLIERHLYRLLRLQVRVEEGDDPGSSRWTRFGSSLVLSSTFP